MANELTKSKKVEEGANLSKAQLELLKLIVEQAPISVTQIEKATGLEPPRLVGMVGWLLRRELIEKVPATGKKVKHGDTFEPSRQGRKLVQASLKPGSNRP